MLSALASGQRHAPFNPACPCFTPLFQCPSDVECLLVLPQRLSSVLCEWPVANHGAVFPGRDMGASPETHPACSSSPFAAFFSHACPMVNSQAPAPALSTRQA